MGYARNIRWDDATIKEKILEVVKNTELDRMPSRNEIRNYFKDERLTNAINKRKGFSAYAQELNLSIKESETYFGKRQERIATEEIVSLGHEARQMPQNFPYDLLVNGCVKVDVKVSRLFRGERGRFYSFNLEKPFCTCDIYLLYLLNDDNTTKDVLVVPSSMAATNTQISVGEEKSKYYKYRDRWDFLEQYSEFLANIA